MNAFLRPRIDPWILAAVLVLVGLGVTMVASSSAPIADLGNGNPYHYLQRQALFAVVGTFALLIGAGVPPAWMERAARPLLVMSLVLLIVVLIPAIGHSAGGARRWIPLGPIQIQAGEIAKIAIVVHLAALLARKKAETVQGALSNVIRTLVVPGIMVFLLLCEPDFGTSVLILVVTLLLLFVGGARVGILSGLVLLAVPAGLIAISTSAYRMKRVLAFLDPWSHRYDIGYQITESLMTLGSGGFWGVGLGASHQKLFFLPAAHTDFILAVLGEELGFVGVALVFCCFAVIAWRGLRAALRIDARFQRLLIIGLTSTLVLQALFNFAVVLGLVPTKGITLPFVSAGGSSLMMSMLTAGMLMRAVADSDPVDERSGAVRTAPRFRPAAEHA